MAQPMEPDHRRPLTICVLQPPLRGPNDTPLESADRTIDLMRDAIEKEKRKSKDEDKDFQKSAIIDLFVLPELCPVGYSEDTFAKYLPTTLDIKEMYGEIDSKFKEFAETYNCTVCYGTIGWEDNRQKEHDDHDNATDSTSGEKYFIRQVVVQGKKDGGTTAAAADANGSVATVLATYDKIHICNYGDCAETRFFTAGSDMKSFQLDDWRFGLMICADIHYPMLSQRLVKYHQVDVLLQPACFMRDMTFRTWKSVREARAVDNSVYFVAGNYAGEYYGEASLTPPWVDDDHEHLILDNSIGYLVATLQHEALQYARTQFPFWKHLCQTESCE